MKSARDIFSYYAKCIGNLMTARNTRVKHWLHEMTENFSNLVKQQYWFHTFTVTYTCTCLRQTVCCVSYFRFAVVVYCHSKRPVMARFLFRAQDQNMTNGDFAFFTFFTQQSPFTDKPWTEYVKEKTDLPRRLQAFYVVKQARICHLHT